MRVARMTRTVLRAVLRLVRKRNSPPIPKMTNPIPIPYFCTIVPITAPTTMPTTMPIPMGNPITIMSFSSMTLSLAWLWFST